MKKMSKTAMVTEMLNNGFDCYNHYSWQYKSFVKGKMSKEKLDAYTFNYLVYHTAGLPIVENYYKAYKENL